MNKLVIAPVPKLVKGGFTLGIVYVETCDKGKPQKDRDYYSYNPITALPPGFIRRLTQRLQAAEANVTSNTARIAGLEALFLEPMNEIRQFFLDNINAEVALNTAIGTVTGTVLTGGIDAVEILESTGNIVILPFRSIYSVIEE